MTGVMQKLAGAGSSVALAAAVLGGLAAGEAWGAPFSIVSDGQDKVWVLDAASGEITFCQQYAPSGPKVIDMIGSEGQARPGAARPAQPYCQLARGAVPDEVRVRFGRVGLNGYADYGMGGYIGSGARGYWGYAPLSGVSGGYGGYGGYGTEPLSFSDGRVVIVRPRTVNVNLY